MPLFLKYQVYSYLYLAKKINLPILNHVDYEGNSYEKIYDLIEHHYIRNKSPFECIVDPLATKLRRPVLTLDVINNKIKGMY